MRAIGSIRFRLWSAAAISILIALAIAGFGLRYLFERHVERRIEADLSVYLDRLVATTTVAADGTLQVGNGLSDPRFEAPASGYYWQVENVATGLLVRSRSLWDGILKLPRGADDGALRRVEIAGPDNTLLVAVGRTITDEGGHAFRAVVAEDHATVTESVDAYVGELAPSLVLLSVVLLAAMFVQIGVGLAPLERLRQALRDVGAGRKSRLDADAPREVRPLADEINRLLDQQDKALARARSRATDLAHGLKTPLQVLAADIRTLRDKGDAALADEIEKSVAAIRRHTERELARARIAPGIATQLESRVEDVTNSVVGVVKRMPASTRLQFVVDIPSGTSMPMDEGDLTEVAGNLIENAARFARATVRIAARSTPASVTLSVSDDGPGIPAADRDAALGRGVRLDSRGGGTGLGLAIVADIVEAYGGRLDLADARPGLRVEILLPRRG
jgi:signal transduction histidine kinase